MNFTRRSVLATMGFGAGAALLNPFFSALASGGSASPRFVFVVEGNGLEPTSLMSNDTRAAIDAAATGSTAGRRWFPQLYGHNTPRVIGNDMASAPALSPLSGGGGASDLTTHAAVVLGLSNVVSGPGHTGYHGGLTCSRSTAQSPGGQSIDAWLAGCPGIGDVTPFDAVRVGVDSRGRNLATETCAAAAGQALPVNLNPFLSYEQLFGFDPGASSHNAFLRRTDMLDFAIQDVNLSLGVFSGNSDERYKLEQYLTSLERVRTRQDHLVALAGQVSGGQPFPLPQDPSSNPLYQSGNHLDLLEAQFENVTAALLGGLTNVAVITSGTGEGFSRMNYRRVLTGSSLPNDLERHDLHHASSNSAAHQGVIHGVHREHVQMIANLARALEATPEDGGTMLDNTVIVYLSDNGEQHHSLAEEWPVLLVGGHHLGMQTDGRSVVYPGVRNTANRQLSNLFNTLGYASGVALDDFGQEGVNRIAEGPLSELG